MKKYLVVLLVALSVLVLVFAVYDLKKKSDMSRSEAMVSYQGPEVPFYPGAVLVSSESGVSMEEFLYDSTWETKDSVPEASVWYQDQFKNSPEWEIVQPPADSSVKDIQLLVVNKGEYIFNLSFLKDDTSGKTKIILQVLSQSQIQEEEEE